MKIYLLLCVAFAFSYCTPSRKVTEKELMGTWKNNTYTNSYFNFKVNLEDENWEIKKSVFPSVVCPEFILGEYFSPDDSIEPIIRFTAFANKANPFGSSSPSEELQVAIDGLEFLDADDSMIFEDFVSASIANKSFTLSRIISLEENGDSTYIDEYMILDKGYFLSFTMSYVGGEHGKIANEILKSIKRAN